MRVFATAYFFNILNFHFGSCTTTDHAAPGYVPVLPKTHHHSQDFIPVGKVGVSCSLLVRCADRPSTSQPPLPCMHDPCRRERDRSGTAETASSHLSSSSRSDPGSTSRREALDRAMRQERGQAGASAAGNMLPTASQASAAIRRAESGGQAEGDAEGDAITIPCDKEDI